MKAVKIGAALFLVGVIVIGCDGGDSKPSGGSFQVVPQNLPPTITAIVPRRGPLAGGTAITIFGAGFVAGQTNVLVNGVGQPHVVTSPNTITMVTPALVGDPGASITVIDTFTGLATTRDPAFGYIQVLTDPAPSAATDDFGGALLTPSLGLGAAAAAIPGRALAVGNFNGDAVPDLAIGVPNKNASAGEVLIFLGVANGLMAIAPGPPTNPITVPGPAAGDRFGFSVAAGDIDGDGDDDLLIGAPGRTSGIGPTPTGGEAYVYFNDGLNPPTFTFSVAYWPINPTPENHGAAVPARQAGYGFAVALGDADLDGDLELFVGEPDSSTGGITSGGVVWVWEVNMVLPLQSGPSEAINGVIVDGNVGTTIGTGQTDPTFGGAFAGADVFFGRPGIANVGARDGGLVVGFTDGVGQGTPFLPGFQNPYYTIAPAFIQNAGGQANAHDGAVLAVADFNGGGAVDVVRGRFMFDGVGADEGRAYVRYSDGARGFPIPIGGELTLQATAPAGGDRFGIGLGAGDVNADGLPDIVVGADGNAVDTGLAFIFLNTGGAFPALPNETLSDPAPGAGNRFGMVIAIGDFNADGLRDIAISAPGTTTADPGRVIIFYSPL